MSGKRAEWKVGLFVALGLALLALLVLGFSKGLSMLSSTYAIRLRASTAGRIKPQAGVLLAGVEVGNVASIELAPDAKSVLLHLRILRRYAIHRDAEFVIEQSGVLGDEFVAIVPGLNQAPLLKDGEEMPCREPFNLQEAARAALGFIHRVDDTARKLNNAIDRIDRLLLNEQTLTNFAESVATLRRGSIQAEKTLGRIDLLVTSNLPPVNQTISNLFAFSTEMRILGHDLQTVLATNSTEVTEAVKSIESSAAMLKSLLTDLQDGKGLAGSLLKDEQLARQFSALASNLTVTSSNLSVTSSNLNTRGLWGILWKPKPKPAKPLRPLPAHPDRR